MASSRTEYLIVRVQVTSRREETITKVRDEILSNLESVVNDIDITDDIGVFPVKDFANNLRTLYRAANDTTPAIECAAALNNFTGHLLEVLDLDLPIVDTEGETNLDYFILR